MGHRERPVRFVWPEERYDRLTRKAAALSAVITTLVAAALSLPIVTVYRAAKGDAPLRADGAPEVVTFVQPEPRLPPVTSSPLPRAMPTARKMAPVERLLNRDTASATAGGTARAGPAASTSSTSGDARPVATGAIGPVAVPVGVVGPPVVGAPPPPWGWLPPTQAERDSTAREQERRVAEARNQHRPVAIPLGGASLPLPFLSRGPSREERARDSVIHADNLARLARLAERARAKQDSLHAVKALAGPVKIDSTARPDDLPR